MRIAISTLALALSIGVMPPPVMHTTRTAAAVPVVTVTRLPPGGVQPDVVTDARGIVHLIYLGGDPKAADVYYATSSDGGQTFGRPTRVNSQPGSAIAVGTIRGAQLAIGRDGRVHVVWNGSSTAATARPGGNASGMPLLYTRSLAGGDFEPQRALMTTTRHLDGGASVAASDAGDVYVAWHGNAVDGPEGEAARRVWLAVSRDDGRTFATETPISPADTGACGCCGLEIATTGRRVDVLYRGARAQVHRDVYALHSTDGGRTFSARLIDAWELGACPMSSMAVLPGASPVFAWEHDGQVAFGGNAAAGGPSPADATDPRARRKHPRLARSAQGHVLLSWAAGTAWNKGGTVGWQLFEGDRAVGAAETRDGLPAWSFPTVAVVGDRFVVLY